MAVCMRVDDSHAPGKAGVVKQLIDLKALCTETISRYTSAGPLRRLDRRLDVAENPKTRARRATSPLL